ncbi:TPA: flagellar filament capping protein FliD [Enterobacter roggenkampii]|uniref:flagellar filament capping protein FliD n=1 Tax=Enterobacter roggenkampii TaxID=1812935 RepID=UPI0027EB0341|nr:flagellar filament capping protein FliD [Enterobacter roggenkampii]
MATVDLSNLGVGSGLPLATLYNNLETAENTKLSAITKQKTTYTAQLSAYGKLQSALTNLQTATTALGKASAWNATSVASTNTAFSATTSTDATTGSYTVNVSQVAKAQVLMSGSIDSNTKQLGGTTSGGTRTLTITQPGTKDPLKITLSDAQTSLTNIASEINKAGGNVSATVMKADDGEYRLFLTSKSTGTDGDMTVTVDGDDTLQQLIGHDMSSSAMSVQTPSQNARVSINGIVIERSSNKIDDALTGVTLTLKAKSSADETLDVTRSTDATAKAVNDWVTAYNALQSTIASVTKYSPVEAGADNQSTSNGALIGDGTVRSVQAQLRSQLTQVQSGSYAIMAQFGITQDPKVGSDGSTGNLKVDTDKLNAALTKNPEAVQAYFMGDGKTTGLATTMGTMLTKMLDTSAGSEGVIQSAQDGINATIKTLDKRYTATEASIEATMARYKAQFTALDSIVTKMNSTSSYLTTQFSKSSS